MSKDAYAYAVTRLAAYDRTIRTLELDLIRRFGAVPEGVIERLVKNGFLDDRRFAENFVRRRNSRGRPWNAAQLERRGVAPEIIREVLEAEKWPSIGDALARKINDLGLTPPIHVRDSARLSRFLERLGYDEEEIRQELEGCL